jgi:hypothetical protein
LVAKLPRQAWAAARNLPIEPGRHRGDPAWSDPGLCPSSLKPGDHFYQSRVTSWYAKHSLLGPGPGGARATKVSWAAGAASPEWSADGKSLVFVSGTPYGFCPSSGPKPVRVAWPLFPPNAWPSHYGDINWQAQFT